MLNKFSKMEGVQILNKKEQKGILAGTDPCKINTPGCYYTVKAGRRACVCNNDSQSNDPRS